MADETPSSNSPRARAIRQFQEAESKGNWTQWRSIGHPPWWDAGAHLVVEIALDEQMDKAGVYRLARTVFEERLIEYETTLSIVRQYEAGRFIVYCGVRFCEAVAKRAVGFVEPAFGTAEQEPVESGQGTPEKLTEGAADWQGIEIVFTSDNRVQIFRKGSNSETLNYAELGFEDGRTRTPNQAWGMLRTLAEERGIIRNGGTIGGNWTKVEKGMQAIRKGLREHFGIAADPIPFVQGVGYNACFKIRCSPSFHT